MGRALPLPNGLVSTSESYSCALRAAVEFLGSAANGIATGCESLVIDKREPGDEVRSKAMTSASYHSSPSLRPSARARRNFETGLLELGDYRVTVRDDRLFRIVDISATAAKTPPQGHAANYQVVLPYHGVFSYRRGRQVDLVDTNQTLLVCADCDFADDHPVKGIGHASIVIVPAPELLEELCGSTNPRSHPAFARGRRPATCRLRIITHRMLAATNDHLRMDELAVQALEEALASDGRRPLPGTSRPVERAKEILHAHGFTLLKLGDIAREVGVSPIHLTQEFTRREGIPLYRYQMQLRLDRALLELPVCDNITALALDLGFSSHSHFSHAFTSMFGMAPSQFRAAASASAISSGPAHSRRAAEPPAILAA